MSGTSVAVRESTGEIIPVEFEMKTYLASLRDSDGLKSQRDLIAAYDEACASLIGPNDVQMEGKRSFKKKSAWRKLGRYFGISTSIVKVEREVMADGHFLAMVTTRASAPWGQHSEEVGACCTDEESGKRKITVADAIATASTRASNRAVSNLIAMGEVSAEEIGRRGEEPKPVALDITRLPGKDTSWGGNGGKLLKDAGNKALTSAREWMAGDPAREQHFAPLITAIEEEMERRRADAPGTTEATATSEPGKPFAAADALSKAPAPRRPIAPEPVPAGSMAPGASAEDDDSDSDLPF